MNEEFLRCSNCSEILEEGWTECPACETPLSRADECPNCGKQIKLNWRKCPWCKGVLSGGSGITSGAGSDPQEQNSESGPNQGFNLYMSGADVGTTPPGGSPRPISSSGPNYGSPIGGPVPPYDQPSPMSTIRINPGEELINGRFTVKEFLGSGGFGAAYLARDKEMNEDLAFKVVFTEFGQAQMAVDQLKFEFKARKKISDRKHILEAELPFTDVFKGVSLILLPMEYADGGSLRDWMRANPLQQDRNEEDSKRRKEQALKYFKQACLGVQAIHEAGLVHLDLKPENLLIHDGIIKVADFGLSRNILQMSMASPELMRDGVGTTVYMSPEQIMAARPKDVDHLADIYSMGCILFELLDGDPPYMGTPQQILEKHEHGIRPKLRDVEQHLSDTIFRCISKDPGERYKTISELLSAIDQKSNSSSVKINNQIEGHKWYYFDPAFCHQFKDRLFTSMVMVDGREANCISAENLLQNGCVNLITFGNRRLSIYSDAAILLASGSIDSLLNWLKEDESSLKENPYYFIKLFWLDGEKESARREIDKWHHGGQFNLFSTIQLVVGYGEVDIAKKELVDMEKISQHSATRLMCAKAWKFLFKDEQQAKKCLLEAEQNADFPTILCMCAEAWKAIFDDDRQAMRCLKDAENKAEYFSILCECAKAWKFLFNDDQQARRCLQKAEDMSFWGSHYSDCAKSYGVIYGEDEARDCLKRGEDKAERCIDLYQISGNWKRLFDDDSEAMRCLGVAEIKANSSQDFCFCAGLWKSLFNNEFEAMRCITEAEKIADSCLGWRSCAKGWKEVFNNVDEAKRCLEEAESMVKYDSEWKSCAETWKEVLNDDNEARRCLRNA